MRKAAVLILLTVMLVGCGGATPTRDTSAIRTQAAQDVIATLTAQAPIATARPTNTPTLTSTPIPRPTHTPTKTPSPTPTSTETATPFPSPTLPPTDTPTPEPTVAPPTPTAPPVGASDVRIECIFYDGQVYRVESDEYVRITNFGGAGQDLAGWRLVDIAEGYPSLVFPSYILGPGESIRVYTNEYHPESGGFSFGYGKAVWNNKEPDMAALYDAQGQEVSRKSYPPGCY